jgi:hypothetical protein
MVQCSVHGFDVFQTKIRAAYFLSTSKPVHQHFRFFAPLLSLFSLVKERDRQGNHEKGARAKKNGTRARMTTKGAIWKQKVQGVFYRILGWMR